MPSTPCPVAHLSRQPPGGTVVAPPVSTQGRTSSQGGHQGCVSHVSTSYGLIHMAILSPELTAKAVSKLVSSLTSCLSAASVTLLLIFFA